MAEHDANSIIALYQRLACKVIFKKKIFLKTTKIKIVFFAKKFVKLYNID